MTDRELLEQLNKLKDVSPSGKWKKSNRDLLYTQISSSVDSEKTFSNFKLSLQMFTSMTQPAMVVLLLFMVMGATGISLRIGENANPGDSLYIAKMINEKTRSSLAFSSKRKAKLEVEFAKNRVKEIQSVENQEEVKELVSNFKNKITLAKNSIKKIHIIEEVENIKVEDAEVEDIASSTDDEFGIFTANSDKDEKGITIYENSDTQDADSILVKVEQLIEDENYSEALVQLDEVANMVEADNVVENIEVVESDNLEEATTSTSSVQVSEDEVEESEEVSTSTNTQE